MWLRLQSGEISMANLIIILIIVVLVMYGVMATGKHFKGEGGCCGGGGKTIRENKKLDGPKLGEKEIQIEGMHCENCQNRVERMVNRIDGVVCKVNLKKKLAVVSYSKPVEDALLKEMVEKAGYEVLGIKER